MKVMSRKALLFKKSIHLDSVSAFEQNGPTKPSDLGYLGKLTRVLYKCGYKVRVL